MSFHQGTFKVPVISVRWYVAKLLLPNSNGYLDIVKNLLYGMYGQQEFQWRILLTDRLWDIYTAQVWRLGQFLQRKKAWATSRSRGGMAWSKWMVHWSCRNSRIHNQRCWSWCFYEKGPCWRRRRASSSSASLQESRHFSEYRARAAIHQLLPSTGEVKHGIFSVRPCKWSNQSQQNACQCEVLVEFTSLAQSGFVRHELSTVLEWSVPGCSHSRVRF